jgi:HlyD family secretion protein
VIVSRRVNVGQTVVAGLNAPSLFLIAKDLRQMQVWASVSEADIGRIYSGMPVLFSVDVAPGRTFHGKVLQVRLNATTTQTVITYTVVVQTENPDGKLLPYLTANLKFVTNQKSDILMVPNAALRWKPQWDEIAPDARNDPLLTSGRGGKSSKTPDQAKSGDSSGRQEERAILWVADSGFVRPIAVHTGITDDSMTEVSGPNLQEGMKVVCGKAHNGDADNDDTKLPFMPRMRGPSKKT